MSAEGEDREFSAFVGGRGTSLLRTAYLVTADEDRADDALVDALARTRIDWTRAEGAESAETYARRQLLADRPRFRMPALLDPAGGDVDAAPRPPAGRDEGDEVASDPEQEGASEEEDRRTLWAAFRELTQGQRAVLVLGLHESLDDEEIAHLVGRSTRAVRADITRALAWLRTFADPPGRQASRPLIERLRELFVVRCEAVRAEADLADRALSRAEVLRGRRRRTTALVVAAVAVVAGVALVGVLLGGGDEGAAPGASAKPSVSGSASGPPGSPTPGPSVVAVPDAVLDLARDEGALLGYGSVIVDGATQPLSALVVDADPTTGASQGSVIVSLARAEGGYVVLTRPTQSATRPETWSLSYVPRSGTTVALARVDYQAPGFAVSPDGLSVVHVFYGSADPSGDLGSGMSTLVVQALGGDVVDTTAARGRVSPLSVDSDHVWFRRADDPPGPPFVWDRQTGATSRLRVDASETATAVRSDFVSTIAGPRDSRCASLYDGHAVRAPQRLWTRCEVWSGALLDPAGGLAGLLLVGNPELAVVDAGSGDDRGLAGLPAEGAIGMAWTSGGQRLLVEQRTGDEVVVVGIPPPTDEAPYIGDPIVYPLGADQVVLGRELPVPGG